MHGTGIERDGTTSWAAALLAGVLIGGLNTVYALSMAAFIFSGSLASHFPQGVGLLMAATVLSATVLAFRSAIPGVISVPKGNICAVIALMAAAIAGSVPPQKTLATLSFAILTGSVITGVTFLGLGRFRLGNLFRFIPYPVMGGYFAGAGLLIFLGALAVMTGASFVPDTWPPLELLDMDRAELWLPGFGLAVVMLLVERRWKHPLLVPLILAAVVALFYLGLFAGGVSLAKARAAGFLFYPFTAPEAWSFLTISTVKMVHLEGVAAQWGNLAAIVLLSLITLVLNVSGLEIGLAGPVDLDREMKAAGTACLASGCLGGVPAFHEDVDTLLAHRLGAGRRLCTLAYALFCGLVLLFGGTLVALFPKPVMGALLMYQGGGLMMEWGWASRRRLPHLDYLLILLIVLVVAFAGFLAGIVCGLVVSAVLFSIQYSRVDCVKQELTGRLMSSRVWRTPEHERLLREKGDSIRIFCLQGFLFFGTATRLLDRVMERLGDGEPEGTRTVVFDFRLVTDLDASAANCFVRLSRLAAERHVFLLFAQLNAPCTRQLEMAGCFRDGHSSPGTCDTLDDALEWSETQLLRGEGEAVLASISLDTQLAGCFVTEEDLARFTAYLSRKTVAGGTLLFRQGDPADALYLLESGSVTVYLEADLHDRRLRLRTMGSGTVIGEMGLYGPGHRSASAVADSDCVLYRLDEDGLRRMEKEDPAVAAAFHRYIVHLLSDRVAAENTTIRELIR
jgi:SulP family sulfate permease